MCCHFYYISVLFLPLSAVFLQHSVVHERPRLLHPRPDSDSPMRCDAMKLTSPTNGQKNAAPAPPTSKRPQPGRMRHMLAKLSYIPNRTI